MAPSSVRPRDQERPFALEELFFSTTDPKGVIRTGNEVFVRISGYTLEELVGKPHNIIRHPDMPRAVFKLLWDYLGDGKVFAGFVKNMASDGCYYWVMALVAEIPDGYLSVRFKPSSPLLSVVRDLYGQMLVIERNAEGRQEGMQAATAHLLAALREKGFPSYDHFMHAALVAELNSRRTKLAPAGPRRYGSGELAEGLRACQAIGRQLDDLFARAGFFLELVGKLDTKFAYLRGLSEHIHLVSMNAIIASHHLAEEGRGVAVVTHSLSAVLEQITDQIAAMTEHMLALTASLRETAFTLATAKLQVETTQFFLGELVDGDALAGNTQTRENIDILVDAFSKSTTSMLATLRRVHEPILPLIQLHDRLVGALRRLNAMRVTGKVQAAYISEAGHFQGLFDEIFAQLQGAKGELRELSAGMNALRNDLPNFREAGWAIQGLLGHFAPRLGAEEIPVVSEMKPAAAPAARAPDLRPGRAAAQPDGEVAAAITKAIAAHGQWKHRLKEAVEKGESEWTVEQVQPDNRCEFGKWLYGLPSGHQESASWQKVQALHATFHREAAQVLELAVTGQSKEAEKHLALGSRFADTSSRLTRAMLAWQHGEG